MTDQAAPAGARGSVPVFRDERGSLTLAELDLLPFSVARVYVLHDIPVGGRRGGHAQRVQHRFLVVVCGRCTVVLDDGRAVEHLELSAGLSLHIGPGVWHEVEALTAGLTVLVMASGPYVTEDYIYDRSRLKTASSTA